MPSGCVSHPHTCSDDLLTQVHAVFQVPGVSLTHSASGGHSNLKSLLLSAVLEAGEDSGQGSSTELGGPRAHSHAHTLHPLSI